LNIHFFFGFDFLMPFSFAASLRLAFLLNVSDVKLYDCCCSLGAAPFTSIIDLNFCCYEHEYKVNLCQSVPNQQQQDD
jgi:hypothetical protein